MSQKPKAKEINQDGVAVYVRRETRVKLAKVAERDRRSIAETIDILADAAIARK